MPIYIKIQFYLFHKKSKRKLLQVSSRGNHQATDTKMNKLTIIVLKSADPYLPDRVEFKHTSLLNLRQDMLFIRAAETYFNMMRTDL